jgi:hypothetical protein
MTEEVSCPFITLLVVVENRELARNTGFDETLDPWCVGPSDLSFFVGEDGRGSPFLLLLFMVRLVVLLEEDGLSFESEVI